MCLRTEVPHLTSLHQGDGDWLSLADTSISACALRLAVFLDVIIALENPERFNCVESRATYDAYYIDLLLSEDYTSFH